MAMPQRDDTIEVVKRPGGLTAGGVRRARQCGIISLWAVRGEDEDICCDIE